MISLHLKKLPATREISLLILAYLYVPILVLIVYSFNANRSATVWTEFSFAWYGRILANPSIQTAALNSIIVATIATVCATAIALLAALATYRPFYGQKMVEGGINLPLILPEIVTAVATLLLFMALGIKLGLMTVIVAHIGFCIPFAYLPIRARLNDMDLSLEQASADLYAGPWRTFRKVTLPLLMPGIFSGLMLAFIVSLDNFVISMMVSQAGTTTLPIFIFGLLRMGVTPDVNAVSTLILGVSVLFVSLSYLLGKKNA